MKYVFLFWFIFMMVATMQHNKMRNQIRNHEPVKLDGQEYLCIKNLKV